MKSWQDAPAALDHWALDYWIKKEIEPLLRQIEDLERLEMQPRQPSVDEDSLRPCAGVLRQALFELQLARQRVPPDLRLGLVVELARAYAYVQGAMAYHWARSLEQQLETFEQYLDAEEELIDAFARILDDFASVLDAMKRRIRSLNIANNERKENVRRELDHMLPEFRRLIDQGLSKSGAARVLAKKHKVSADTIRKRLGHG